ncbi:MAG: glycerol-3-phosphate responsive antiterminator [Lachnospiraceae bacterium]|nr:glycerol-3-phosphate responsive antiterminator [Lachnospiraceae bacterium]
MKNREFVEKVEQNPIIAAVKNDEGLELSLTSDLEVIFILYGDVCTIPEIVRRIKAAGKTAMVHVDLINGLSSRDIALDYIRSFTEADGIITTKNALIPHAKELKLNTVLRYFVLDSMALVNIEKGARAGVAQPDFIEFLPGIILPSMIRKINEISRVPVLAGGLIQDKEDVMNALSNGVTAISSTNQNVWFL